MQITPSRFPHTRVGPKGVGGQLFVNMERFLDVSTFNDLHMECIIGLSLVEKFNLSYVPGEVPPELRPQFQGMHLESEVLQDIEAFDPTGIHRKNMEPMTTQQRRRYLYLALGVISPWYGTCYLIENDFATKTIERNHWNENSKKFPKLVTYIQSLQGRIFSTIGRVVFFISYPLQPVVTHRDSAPMNHQDHCINFFFSKGRPTFIYNEMTQEKHYLDAQCRAYYFNNRDYHGLDAEPEMRYTLRVDGQFLPHIAEQIGLNHGWVE